jgi:hypothetical protein
MPSIDPTGKLDQGQLSIARDSVTDANCWTAQRRC